MASFYLTLPSNVKNDLHTNTISHFQTRLHKKYSFPVNENWEVAVVEISYPKSWYTLQVPQKISLFTFNFSAVNTFDFIENDLAVLPPGHYDDPDRLMDAINDILNSKYKTVVKALPVLKFNKDTEHVEYSIPFVRDSPTYFVKFDKELETILGFTDDNDKSIMDHLSYSKITEYIKATYLDGLVRSFKPLKLHAGYHTLYLYSDIVQFSGVGNTNAQILRALEVPSNKYFGDQVVLTYNNPYYIPLLRREFETLEIELKDETGNTVPFELGRVIVVLHFRKNESIH